MSVTVYSEIVDLDRLVPRTTDHEREGKENQLFHWTSD